MSEDHRDPSDRRKSRGRTKPEVMRAFADAWPDRAIVQRTAAQLPWRSNLTLLDKLADPAIRLWYAQKALELGMGKDMLAIQIETRLYERQGKAINNFLNGEEADPKKRLKDAESALNALAYKHYPKLTEAEIKTLVVDDKWLAALAAAIHGEMDRLSQQLTQLVKKLAERYETPMPRLTERVVELEGKVSRHLERMGFTL